MVDSYIWGKVNRISPEAPVPIVAVEKKENRLGGAANVAINIKALGANPILCSVVGKDSSGNDFVGLLKQVTLDVSGIMQSKERRTTVKTRIIGNKHQLIRIDDEIDSTLNNKENKLLIEKVIQLIKKKKIDVVVFEDYDKGVLSSETIKNIISFCSEKNIPCTVDPKKTNFGFYQNISLFKPNVKELTEGLKVDLNAFNLDSLNKIVDSFRKKNNIENILVTLSEKGVYVNNGKIKKIIPAHRRNIADVSGAGDTVISVAALCIALQLPIEFTASLSNLAGGLVCEQVGVVPIEKKQLLQEALLYLKN